jgi:hypothetical protein
MGAAEMDRREFLGAMATFTGGAVAAAMTPNLLQAAPTTEPAAATPPAMPSSNSGYLETVNGWYTHNGKAVWGNAQHNHWWGGYRGDPHGWWSDAGLSPSLIRNDPGKIGINRTEDFAKLTDSMLAYGYPGFEHTPPLWYDRRRDAHDRKPRTDGNVVAPFLEMPWARSGQGQASDGLSRYDLTKFNDWYFARVKAFADECDRKGTILFFNFYNQHNLLESPAHYIDYPWRPDNCIQATGLPEANPAANVFYDVSNPLRRQLHQLFIRHCLDALRDNRNVVFLTGFEFTGPLPFMQFWLDTILEWEQTAGRKVHIGLVATKDVTDAVLQDPHYGPRIGTIYMRYWFLNADGTLNAPAGGKEVPGRFANQSGEMKPLQVYQMTKEYRLRYPDKAIVNLLGGDQQKTMAFLMAGGSMLVRGMDYTREYPQDYEMPLGCENILPVYDFIRNFISEDLTKMRPVAVVDKPDTAWCIGDPGNSYLLYLPFGNQYIYMDLTNVPGTFEARWIGMRLGKVFAYTADPGSDEGKTVRGYGGKYEGGKVVEVAGPDQQPWLLWLKKRA